MRLFWPAAIAVLVAAPARADVTARYVIGPGPTGMPPMIIEVNDRGDSRMTMGNSMAVLTLDGISYIVMADLGGTFVARQDDVLAIQVESARAFLNRDLPERQHGAHAPPIPAMPAFRAVQGGSETVGGRTGTIWSLQNSTSHAAPPGMDFVVSTDPDLAPIGRAFARQFTSSRAALRQMTGPPLADADAGFFDGIMAIFERGTVIRWGRLMRLESVDAHAILASDFVLPSPPLTREQLAARMQGAAPH